ncbi:hypothetical protein GGI07_003252 [Coemansia sp. Benny D115]|nr:hypothetical protein GGI07_003252 [Coemansia sp. Benny D115]
MSSKPIVVVTRLLPTLAQERLESLSDQLTIRQHRSTKPMDRADLLRQAKGAHALVVLLADRIDEELLDAAGPQLRIVSTISVGYDHVDTAALRARGVKLGYTPDVLTDATADTTVLLALMASRRAKSALLQLVTGRVAGGFSLSEGLGMQFTGKTLGIVGLGRIGAATAHRLQAFGFARILYTASQARPERADSLGAEHATFDELLQASDLVCICCPLSDRTRGMFDDRAFSLMKQGSILINTARGAIVDQDALLRALDAGRLMHAGLDVTEPEPLPVDHPLLVHERTTILPHIGSATEDARNAMSNLAVDNALAAIRGEQLKAEVRLD